MRVASREKKHVTIDDFAKSPISALLEKFRHCGVPVSTPHSSIFPRLDLELFSKSSVQMTFCESIKINELAKSNLLYDSNAQKFEIKKRKS